ncbi:hypothetical protein PSPO01_04833 [Paraphaeosphaeria sporulosa]
MDEQASWSGTSLIDERTKVKDDHISPEDSHAATCALPTGVMSEALTDLPGTGFITNFEPQPSQPAPANDEFGSGTSTIISVHPPPPEVPSAYMSSVFKSPKNTRATLLNLPPELRQEIYDHLYPSQLTHVIFSHTNHKGSSGPHYVFQGCKAPDPLLPQLCSRPPFSGSFPDPERCTQVEHADAYDLRLAETCVVLRAEVLRRICYRMSIAAAERFFKHYGNKWKSNIHHLTLTCEGHSDSKYWDLGSAIGLVQSIVLPNLESLNTQTRRYTSEERVRDLFLPDGEFSKRNWLQMEFNRAVRSRTRKPSLLCGHYYQWEVFPRRTLSPTPLISICVEWWYRVCPRRWTHSHIEDHEMLKVRTAVPAGGFTDPELQQFWDTISEMSMEKLHTAAGWRAWQSYYDYVDRPWW